MVKYGMPQTHFLLTPIEVAERLRVSEMTLRRWRKDGTGPKAVYLSPRTIRYRSEDVTAWLAEHPKFRETTETQDTKT